MIQTATTTAGRSPNVGAAGAEPVIVNGGAGLLVRFPARSFLAGFTVVEGRIVAIDIIADPAKLRALEGA